MLRRGKEKERWETERRRRPNWKHHAVLIRGSSEPVVMGVVVLVLGSAGGAGGTKYRGVSTWWMGWESAEENHWPRSDLMTSRLSRGVSWIVIRQATGVGAEEAGRSGRDWLMGHASGPHLLVLSYSKR